MALWGYMQILPASTVSDDPAFDAWKEHALQQARAEAQRQGYQLAEQVTWMQVPLIHDPEWYGDDARSTALRCTAYGEAPTAWQVLLKAEITGTGPVPASP